MVDDIIDNLILLVIVYVRVRGVDRMSFFGDWVVFFDVCDFFIVKIILREVSLIMFIIICK